MSCLVNQRILLCNKFCVCMIRKCFQVQDGAIIVAVAAATTVTTVYNLHIYGDLGEGSWPNFLRC